MLMCMADEQKFQVDDLVQCVQNNKIMDGKITKVIPPKVNRSTIERSQFFTLTFQAQLDTEYHYDIQWNSGKTSLNITESNYNTGLHIAPQDSALERKFRLEMMKITPNIKEKTDAALALIEDACKIAEQYGIPFKSPLAITDNDYVPASFNSKFFNLGTEDIKHIAGIYSEYDCGGWQTSYC